MIRPPTAGSKKFESHASFQTNMRMTILFGTVDMLGPRAWQSMKLQDIQAYFQQVNQIFKNVKDVLDTALQADSCRKKYMQLFELANTDPRYRGHKSLRMLLELTDEMFSQIVTGMQRWSYFYRIGSHQKKGLKNIRFFDDTIFSGGGTDGDTGEDTAVLEEQVEGD